jgi:hypothetical protein
VREVFGLGVRLVGAGQAALWPPAAFVTVDVAREKDPLIRLAAAMRWPCVPLRRRLTILGTDWAWARFAATASRADRACALDYLERLRGSSARRRLSDAAASHVRRQPLQRRRSEST